jgi:uncharacterized protein YggE
MNKTLKNILGGVSVIAVLALGYAAISYADSYGKSIPPSSFRSFTVSGEGKATAIPDVAEFNFTVTTEGGKDIAASQAANTTAMNKAIAFVKSDGVADKDITTESYNIDPRYQTYSCSPKPVVYNDISVSTGGAEASVPAIASTCPPSTIIGYTVTQSVDVKVRDFTKIGDIMNGVVKNGANEVGSLSFTLDDPTSVQNEARADALTKAKAQAQAIAQESGFKIGRLLSVDESGGYQPVAYNTAQKSMAMESAGGSAPTATIQPGSQEVDETMTLQYEIE